MFLKVFILSKMILLAFAIMGGSRGGGGGGGQGVRTHPEKSQKYRVFFNNTRPDPLKNQKDTKPLFNVGPSAARQRNAI